MRCVAHEISVFRVSAYGALGRGYLGLVVSWLRGIRRT